MLDRIKFFFEHQIALSDTQKKSETNLQIACAALLIEMMHIDDRIDEAEKASIVDRLEALFSLEPEQTEQLLALAAEQREQSTDYFQFTHLINQTFTVEQKVQLIESLWRVAYADAKLDAYEEYLVRKIADLLFVSHRDFIMAKNRVKSELT